jgi:hypothetical protein
MGDAGSVHVDPDALRKYGWELFSHGQTQAMKVSEHLASVVPLVQSLTTPTDAGNFAEGAVIAGILMQATNDFSAFTKDLTTGLMFMGSAAGVIATAYRNGDVESAQSIDVIDYAFGDSTADKPAGLQGHDKTYSEQAMEQAANGPQPSMASLGMDDFITTTVPLGYMTIMYYQDGSEKIVGSQYSIVDGVDGSTSTVTYTDANGKTVRSTATTKGTNADGRPVTVTKDSQDGQTVTTSTTENADNSITVTTTTQVGDGPPSTTTTVAHPHTHSGDAKGPVQQAETDYGLEQQGW